MLKRYLQDESGATAIEYALIAALIAMGLVGGATALGKALDTQFKAHATALGGT